MNMRAKSKLQGKRANNVPFLTHPDEPIDTFAEYLSEDSQPADGSSNSKNLFDDSNVIDRIWLKSAQAYLRGLR